MTAQGVGRGGTSRRVAGPVFFSWRISVTPIDLAVLPSILFGEFPSLDSQIDPERDDPWLDARLPLALALLPPRHVPFAGCATHWELSSARVAAGRGLWAPAPTTGLRARWPRFRRRTLPPPPPPPPPGATSPPSFRPPFPASVEKVPPLSPGAATRAPTRGRTAVADVASRAAAPDPPPARARPSPPATHGTVPSPPRSGPSTTSCACVFCAEPRPATPGRRCRRRCGCRGAGSTPTGGRGGAGGRRGRRQRGPSRPARPNLPPLSTAISSARATWTTPS